MRTRIFRVHRRVVDRLPSRLTVSGRVAINIAVANCRYWPPEVVMVFGVEHSYERVVEPNRHERHEPRAVAHTHLLCGHELAHERMIGWRTGQEPEPGGLGLLGRSLLTGLSAIVFELIEVCCPLFALERDRRALAPKSSGGEGVPGRYACAAELSRSIIAAWTFSITR